MSRQKRRRLQAMEEDDVEEDGRMQAAAARAAKKSSRAIPMTKMRPQKSNGKKKSKKQIKHFLYRSII